MSEVMQMTDLCLCRQVMHQFMNFRFCFNVDADGRLVDDEDVRFYGKPLAYD